LFSAFLKIDFAMGIYSMMQFSLGMASRIRTTFLYEMLWLGMAWYSFCSSLEKYIDLEHQLLWGSFGYLVYLQSMAFFFCFLNFVLTISAPVFQSFSMF
jgi:ABC-type siderophore export system fused ATPase/permease subunit